MDDQANRPHRKSKEKKKKAHGGIASILYFFQRWREIADLFPSEKNVKAFVVANPGRLQKQAVRSSDVS